MRDSIFSKFGYKQQRTLLVALLFSVTAYAQDLCNTLPSGAVAGGFSLTGPAVGCSPFAVNIQDNSGGTDVKYYYYYKGGGLSELSTLTPTTALTETYLGGPTTWTILQVGKKSGKDMYACKNVTVRPNNQPFYPPPSNCGPNFLTIEIPNHPTNTFDYYEVDWGDSSTEKVSLLPFKKLHTYSNALFTRTIKVNGFYNDILKNCPTQSETITLDAKSDQPILSKLEVLPGGNKVMITLEGSTEAHELFLRNPLVENDYPSTPFSTIKPGQTTLNLPNVGQSCFRIFYYPNCPKTSGEICTIKLDSITVLGSSNKATWNLHPTGSITRVGFVNIDATSQKYTQKLKTFLPNNVLQNEKVINAGITEFIDNYDCKKEVCYQIEVKASGITSGSKLIPYQGISLSEKKCIDRKLLFPPPITDASASVNAANSIEIAFTDNSNWNLNKELFRLKRLDAGNYATIDSTKNSGSFSDSKVATDLQAYCYAINYTDECGSTSLDSPPFCSIHLSSPNATDLIWTPESPFASHRPLFYEVIVFGDSTNVPSVEKQLDSTAISFTPDLSQFQNLARYQIKATDKNGNVSFSNSLEIPIQANIFLPTAFTPNGDKDNPKFLVKGTLGRITSFNFTIYNRWGEQVFASKEKTLGWDGKINGDNAPSGYYSYQIIAKTNTGEIVEKKGMVLLMR